MEKESIHRYAASQYRKSFVGMRINACFIGCLLLVLYVAPQAVLAQDGQKRRIAVLDFDYKGAPRELTIEWDIGRQMSDLIIDQLNEDGTYEVVERKKLDEVFKESNMSLDERFNEQTASKIGQLVGSNAVVMGSFNQFTIEKSGISVLGQGRTVRKAKVGLSVRIVDVNTGVVIASAAVKDEKQKTEIVTMYGGNKTDDTDPAVKQAFLADAMQGCAKKAVKQLVGFKSTVAAISSPAQTSSTSNQAAQASPKAAPAAASPAATPPSSVRGKIAQVKSDGKTVFLNIGSAQGVVVGSTYSVVSVGEVIKDPDTGKVLGETTKEIGQVKITKVDDMFSTGTLVSGTGKPGNVVKSSAVLKNP